MEARKHSLQDNLMEDKEACAPLASGAGDLSSHQRAISSPTFASPPNNRRRHRLSNITSPEGNHGLRSSISGLLDSGLYTDATIECGGKTFHVHKAVICSQSDYFARAFNEHTGFKEANTSTVVLQEIHPSTVQEIIECL
ncbi:hypothetical protein IWX90DRAFT_481955 [Phyllosticta citrichinensis]|uniref:BTB domain-containing protein n=1 Tax=Phyllosticta citrichinensis TaxID=1130410 RepID=A0ABR1Y584_9PEZI